MDKPDTSRIIYGRSRPEKREAAKRMRREMTPAETTLWQCLRANRLGGRHFRRQQVIDGFIADFYCHAAALIVEVDGPIHDERRDYDAARDQLLATRGLRIVRVTNQEIEENLPAVLALIEQAAPLDSPSELPLPYERSEQIRGGGRGERPEGARERHY